MDCFRTERVIEDGLKPFYAPIIWPCGRKEMAEITREAYYSYQDLREMGVPDERFSRYAQRVQKQTGLPYPVCFSMGAIIGPWEFFEGWPFEKSVK